jgi:hypothetical protein
VLPETVNGLNVPINGSRTLWVSCVDDSPAETFAPSSVLLQVLSGLFFQE